MTSLGPIAHSVEITAPPELLRDGIDKRGESALDDIVQALHTWWRSLPNPTPD